MTDATLAPDAAVSAPRAEEDTVSAAAVFFALLRRDVKVARRELPFFLVRTVMQPILFIIVFGALLPKMGFMARGYQATLVPGIVAISLSLAAIQAVSLPMMQDFGWTKEIEDRLLAPVPTRVVAAEKIVAGVLQGIVSALVVLPVARIVMGPIAGLTLSHLPALVGVTIIGAAAFSAMGMWIGTAISPQQIGLMFSVIITPMLFFGCAYYPWRGLDVVPALKWAVLVNPMVYVAEGLRGALTPTIPHMPLGVVLVALAAISIAFWTLGMRSFLKRALG